jgi:hypothetical protein
VSVISFGLWQITHSQSQAGNVRAGYFVLPLELLGHLSAAAILLYYPIFYRNLPGVWNESAISGVLVRDLLTLSLIYGVISIFYRVRWGVDAAFILARIAVE